MSMEEDSLLLGLSFKSLSHSSLSCTDSDCSFELCRKKKKTRKPKPAPRPIMGNFAAQSSTAGENRNAAMFNGGGIEPINVMEIPNSVFEDQEADLDVTFGNLMRGNLAEIEILDITLDPFASDFVWNQQQSGDFQHLPDLQSLDRPLGSKIKDLSEEKLQPNNASGFDDATYLASHSKDVQQLGDSDPNSLALNQHTYTDDNAGGFEMQPNMGLSFRPKLASTPIRTSSVVSYGLDLANSTNQDHSSEVTIRPSSPNVASPPIGAPTFSKLIERGKSTDNVEEQLHSSVLKNSLGLTITSSHVPGTQATRFQRASNKNLYGRFHSSIN